MVRRTVGALAIAAATVALIVFVTAQREDKAQQKEKAQPQDAKPAATTALTAKLVKVDMAKSIITIDDAGNERELRVTEQTKIIGPRGAVNKARLKDERFAPGWEMRLTIAADGKKLVQIQLPLRKD